MRPGEAFATRFSGTAVVDGTTVIDEAGTVGSIIDIRTPGQAPRGEHWWNEPQRFPVTAHDVGQVFGVALDDASPPNVYLTATAAFGLHRNADNSGWMAGMWGVDGGPGTVYRLRADNNYRPEVFATISLAGRDNTGAALGNIAFDSAHRQFLVSDLETGMIHRLSLEDGTDLGHYDHGTQGRTAFVDVATGQQLSLAPVAFDPDSRAQVNDCAAGSFARTPECWNVADFRRRVWGLGVHHDAESDTVRLYYALWGGQGFSNGDWVGSGDERRNSVWSIGLLEDGAFDLGDIRREFFTPALFTDAGELERNGESQPVSDIAFATASGRNVMVLAERGGLRNLGLDQENAFAVPHGARVLRYEFGDDGQWQPAGRYDVGFYDRRDEGQPFVRANSSGGVAFGYGYGPSFEVDTNQPDAWLWATGDWLCSPQGLCFDSSADRHTDASQVNGMQGMAEQPFDELLPEAATRPYPAEGPATPPDTPNRAAMIDFDMNVDASGNGIEAERTRNDATRPGDVEIYQGAAEAQPEDQQQPGAEEVPTEDQVPPADEVPPGEEVPPGDEVPPAGLHGFDLGIEKFQPEGCTPGEQCRYRVVITNNGPDVYEGPVFFQDALPDDAVYVGFIAEGPGAGWTCEPAEDWVNCRHESVTLAPGESLAVWIVIDLPAPAEGILLNCADILWPMADDGTEARVNLWVEEALNLEGYPVGPVDGVIDPVTRDAILHYQHDHGLAETGTVTAELRAALFPGSAGERGDLNPGNEHACTELPVGPVPHPPGDGEDEGGDEAAHGIDLAVEIDPRGPCNRGATCVFETRLANLGPDDQSADTETLVRRQYVLITADGTEVELYVHDTNYGRTGIEAGAAYAYHGPTPTIPEADNYTMVRLCETFLPEESHVTERDTDEARANNHMCQTVDLVGPSDGEEPEVAPEPENIDLRIEKKGPDTCVRGRICEYTITVNNDGPARYIGPLWVQDFWPGGGQISDLDIAPGSWHCISEGYRGYACQSEAMTLEPGASVELTVNWPVPQDYDLGLARNCAAVRFPMVHDRDDLDFVSYVLKALEISGFSAGYTYAGSSGTDDGLNENARDAISRYREHHGLTPGTEIDDELLNSLWPGSAALQGDNDSENNTRCVEVEIVRPSIDLAISKTVIRDQSCNPGEDCRFTVSVENRATEDYTGTIVVDDFATIDDDGLPATAVTSPSIWDCSALGGSENVRRCTRHATIHQGAGIAFEVRVRVPDTLEGNHVLENCAQIAGSAPSPSGEHDQVSENDGPVCAHRTVSGRGADISIEGHSSCERGTTCRNITLTLSNQGDATYSGALGLRGTLAPVVPILSVEASGGWSCSVLGGGAYNCHNPGITLAPGASQLIRLVVDIPKSFSARRIRHSMQVIWPGHDPDSPPPQGAGDSNPDNDRDSVWVTITDPAAQRLICQHGTVVGVRCVCRAGFEPRQLKPNIYRCVRIPPAQQPIQCTNGAVVGENCVCKSGWTLNRLGPRAWRCLPPKPPAQTIQCVGGTVIGGQCACRKGWTLSRTGPQAWRCLPPKPPVKPIRCVNGAVVGDQCVCKSGWTLNRTAPNAWRCLPPKPPTQKIRCYNGVVSAGRCVCNQGWKLQRIGPTAWRCTAPRARPLRCSGGKAVNGQCVCPRGMRARRIGDNLYRCVKR